MYGAAYEFIPTQDSFCLRTVIPQGAAEVGVLMEQLTELARPVIFLGDGVPVYRNIINEKCNVPYAFAPACNNRQRAASVAALGGVYYRQGRTVSAAEHSPEYLRKSQAEREAEQK